MIQQIDRKARRPDVPKSDAGDGPEIWGNWAGLRFVYSARLGLHSHLVQALLFGDCPASFACQNVWVRR